MIDFSSFKMLTFDCYGTLIDWETGILNALKPIMAAHSVKTSDYQLLETYGRLESFIESGPYQTYREILRQVVIRLGAEFGFDPTEREIASLPESLKNWPPFDDTVAALKRLKSKYELGIISNIDDDLFELSNQLLEVEFDKIITAKQAQCYKPSLRTFEFALRKLDLTSHEILHVAQSLFHDHVPAKKIGLSTVWINRRRTQPGDSHGATPKAEATPDAEFYDLKSFADAACG